MQQAKTKIKIFSTSKTELLWTVGLIFSATLVPALLAHTPQNQWITGTIVNSILFISAWKLGIVNATLIAIIPSSIALNRGLLLPPQIMILPFIILSNIALILTFINFKKSLFLGVLFASILKFALLAGTVSFLFAEKLPIAMIQMMQFPQLITALAGGFLAVTLIKKLKK